MLCCLRFSLRCRHMAEFGQWGKSRRKATPKRILQWPCQHHCCPTCTWSNLPCNWEHFTWRSAESPEASRTRLKHQLSITRWNVGWNTRWAECAIHLFSFLAWNWTALPFFNYHLPPLLLLPPSVLVKGASWKLTLHMWSPGRLQTPEHLEGSGTKQKMRLPHDKGPRGHNSTENL